MIDIFIFNLNQYLDRSIYVDIEEIEEETGTGEIIPDTTATGSIEVINTEIITEEEFLEEETLLEEEIVDEGEIELDGKLLYDNNGNLIGNNLNSKRQYIYSYDYKNRLVKIEKNIYKKVNDSETNEIELKEKIVEIQYDVLGRRIQKLFNNGSYRNYIYSNQHVILEENYSKKDKLKNSKQFTYSNSLDDVLSMKLIENKTRKIKEEYVNAKGNTKTRKIKEEYVETNNYFYQKDHLGSIIAITDETGTIVEEYSYDVFGKPYTKKSDGTITKLKKSPIGNTRMYTGREYALTEGRKCPWGVNRGLKLYYNRARYYNPQLGRFISRDSIDIADDVNLYAYVGNNGVMFVDLMGMEKDLVINKKTLERINGLHPFIRESVEDFVREVYKKLGVELFITDGFRTFEEQNELYNQGRYGNAGSVVTWAKGGYSYHNYGLGFDVSSLSEDGRRLNYNLDWNAIGKIGKDAGFEWGGDWKGKMDRPHFQETYQYTTTELLKFVQNGKIDSEGYIEGYALFEIE